MQFGLFSQKQLLIDSLLNEIDIPKLYFREVSKRAFEYEVVDGQQRLRALQEYMDDGFPLPDNSDPVDGRDTQARLFSKLHTDLQLKLQGQPLDIVILSAGYGDEDVEDMFLRLQNGTPLNAAEKRRALPGNMRHVVAELAEHEVFKLCSFKNHRFAFEDVVAKVLHLVLHGSVTDIRQGSLRRTYENNKNITSKDAAVRRANAAFNFIAKAFRNQPNPRFKKYALISLAHLTAEMIESYNIGDFAEEIGKAYLEFEVRRIANEEHPEESQDPKLAAFTDAARADSIPDIQYRHIYLRDVVLLGAPKVARKDDDRNFSDEQRLALFVRDGGICCSCGKSCEQGAFHADHIMPHSKGGKTSLANGQLLCVACNLKKSSSA